MFFGCGLVFDVRCDVGRVLLFYVVGIVVDLVCVIVFIEVGVSVDEMDYKGRILFWYLVNLGG